MFQLRNALLVCPTCGELMIAPPESWNCRGSPQEMRSSTVRRRPAGQKLEITVHGLDKTSWKFQKKLDDEVEKLAPGCDDLTIVCASCAAQTLSLLSSQVDFFVEQSLYLSRNAGVDKSSVENVDAVVKQMKEQHAEFVAALQAREETSIEWRREPLQFTPTMIEIPEEGPRETRSGEEHNRGFSSLVLCRTFYIHSEKMYGAINGMRLGWCALDPVPQWEIRCALVELGRLIEVVSIYTRVMVNNIRVREEMEVIGEDGEFAPVETGFMKSSRQNTEFNRQMVVLFGVCAELFESKFIATSVFSPVFGIDMTKRTIDGESFAFNKKRPDGWSKAMRLLLLNFKSIQTRALERAVYDMETAK